MQDLRKRFQKGFTLIELLVVIAIIGILAAMLMPALNRARESARKGVCQSNLKQIGNGLFMYAQDWGDAFPNGWHAGTVAFTIGDFQTMIKGGKYGTGAVFYCPSDRNVVTQDADFYFTVPTAPAGAICAASGIRDFDRVYSATVKREVSYAYATRMDNMTQFLPIGGGIVAPYNQNMATLAVDMAGSASSAYNIPSRWQWNIVTYVPSHGPGGVNVLVADGHVRWSTLRDSSGAAPTQDTAARDVPNCYIAANTTKGFLANP